MTDDEPITRERLLSIGFQESESDDEDDLDEYLWINSVKRVRFDVQFREFDGRWECVLARCDGHMEMPEYKTMGEVKRLLAALGVGP